MRCYEEQQFTFDRDATGIDEIVTAEVILTDRAGKQYRLILQDTSQRHITVQVTTRRVVSAPEGYLTQVSEKVGMASATVHLTGIVKEHQ